MPMKRQAGDDLEDDYIADGLLADSAGEDQSSTSEDEAPAAGPSGSNIEASESQTADERAQEKKRKRRLKEKARKAKRQKVFDLSGPRDSLSIACESPSTQVDYISQLQDKAFTKLTQIELDEYRIPDHAFIDTSAWGPTRALDQLPEFIMKMVPNLKTRLGQKSKEAGAPTLLFIAGGALRVADAMRVLKTKRLRGEKGGDVAKLFARHFKLEEHVAYLKRAKIGSAVGTPGRIGKLLCETDALSTSALTHIMLDISYRDVKKRTLLDIPETRDEVLKTILGAPSVRQAISKGKVQVVLF